MFTYSQDFTREGGGLPYIPGGSAPLAPSPLPGYDCCKLVGKSGKSQKNSTSEISRHFEYSVEDFAENSIKNRFLE